MHSFFSTVSDVLRHQTLCRSAASAANNTNALRAFTVRPLTSHPLVHSAYDASQQSDRCITSNSYRKPWCRVRYCKPLHAYITPAQHLHRGSYWWFGFQSLLQSIPIRTFTFVGVQAVACDHRTNGVEALIRTTATLGRNDASRRAHCITKALTGVTTQ